MKVELQQVLDQDHGNLHIIWERCGSFLALALEMKNISRESFHPADESVRSPQKHSRHSGWCPGYQQENKRKVHSVGHFKGLTRVQRDDRREKGRFIATKDKEMFRNEKVNLKIFVKTRIDTLGNQRKGVRVVPQWSVSQLCEMGLSLCPVCADFSCCLGLHGTKHAKAKWVGAPSWVISCLVSVASGISSRAPWSCTGQASIENGLVLARYAPQNIVTCLLPVFSGWA